jgi:hypothetical protein
MMTSLGTAAVLAASETIGSLEFEILDLDPDVTALMAEVDAILCAALTLARRPPAPPVAGSDISRPGQLDGPAMRRPLPGPRQCTPCEPFNAALRPENNP